MFQCSRGPCAGCNKTGLMPADAAIWVELVGKNPPALDWHHAQGHAAALNLAEDAHLSHYCEFVDALCMKHPAAKGCTDDGTLAIVPIYTPNLD
jgi:hypothetical protein